MTATQHDRETLDFLGALENAHQEAESPTRARRAGGRRSTNFFTDFQANCGWSTDGFTSSPHRGGFDGGKLNRITDDWNPGNIGPNRSFAMDGTRLRERAWDLYNNNPFAASAINAYIANVIESGIFPEREDPAWENAWRRWGGLTAHATRECDLSEDQTVYELSHCWLREILVGGGCLTHYLTLPRRTRRLPLALELIPEERFADHLDSFSPANNPKTANRVWKGHEIDQASGKSIAWHVLAARPNDLPEDPFATVRIRRENGEYAYIKERSGQKRGTTLMKAAVLWLWALGYYTDAELIAANAKADWAYIIKTVGTPPDLLADSDPETGLYDVNNNRLDKHEPGMVWRGTADDTIEKLGPNVPPGDSLAWLMFIQRAIAVGIGLSYEETFRDYSKGSFSAVRMARGQDKKRYRPLQQFTIGHFGNPTIRRFDLAGVGALLEGFPAPAEFAGVVDELWDGQEWNEPGWESPNPKDDAAADKIRILETRTKSRTEAIAERGGSRKRVFEQLEREERELEEREIAPVPMPGAAAPEEEGTTEDTETEEGVGNRE